MKRIVIIIFLGILIASCGARRKSNLSQANSKKLGVISEKSNKSNNEVKSLVIITNLTMRLSHLLSAPLCNISPFLKRSL